MLIEYQVVVLFLILISFMPSSRFDRYPKVFIFGYLMKYIHKYSLYIAIFFIIVSIGFLAAANDLSSITLENLSFLTDSHIHFDIDKIFKKK